jgi:hypothetical protein
MPEPAFLSSDSSDSKHPAMSSKLKPSFAPLDVRMTKTSDFLAVGSPSHRLSSCNCLG